MKAAEVTPWWLFEFTENCRCPLIYPSCDGSECHGWTQSLSKCAGLRHNLRPALARLTQRLHFTITMTHLLTKVSKSMLLFLILPGVSRHTRANSFSRQRARLPTLKRECVHFHSFTHKLLRGDAVARSQKPRAHCIPHLSRPWTERQLSHLPVNKYFTLKHRRDLPASSLLF